MLLANSTCLFFHSSKSFILEIFSRIPFVRLPTNTNPPIHMCWARQLPIAASQIFMKSRNTFQKMTDGFCYRHLLIIYFDPAADSTTYLSSRQASGNFYSKNLYIIGIAGPQKDRSRLMQLMSGMFRFVQKNFMYSITSSSMYGMSVCPPSEPNQYTLFLCLKGDVQRIEFPSPVPGPIMPKVSYLFIWYPFKDTNSSSGTNSNPKELASKSFMSLKVGMFNSCESLSPSITPHFLTLAIESLLFLTGPAMAMAATSGYTSTSDRNFFKHSPKSGSSATKQSALLTVLYGELLGGLMTTSSRRILVPPTSPRSEQVGLNYQLVDSLEGVVLCLVLKMKDLARTPAMTALTPRPTLMAIYLVICEKQILYLKLDQ